MPGFIEINCGKNKCFIRINLERFSRLGILKTLQYFKTLESYGVEIKSYTQPYLDTSNSSISSTI